MKKKKNVALNRWRKGHFLQFTSWKSYNALFSLSWNTYAMQLKFFPILCLSMKDHKNAMSIWGLEIYFS